MVARAPVNHPKSHSDMIFFKKYAKKSGTRSKISGLKLSFHVFRIDTDLTEIYQSEYCDRNDFQSSYGAFIITQETHILEAVKGQQQIEALYLLKCFVEIFFVFRHVFRHLRLIMENLRLALFNQVGFNFNIPRQSWKTGVLINDCADVSKIVACYLPCPNAAMFQQNVFIFEIFLSPPPISK